MIELKPLDLAQILRTQFVLYDAALIDNLGHTVEGGLVVPVPGVCGVHPDRMLRQARAFIQAFPADTRHGYTIGCYDGDLAMPFIQLVDFPYSIEEAHDLALAWGSEIWDLTRGEVIQTFRAR